jgi:plasmid stabilization system protein ParE
MGFRVEIAPQAYADLDAIADYIEERGSFASAERWFNGIIDAVRGLKDQPSRFPVAQESEDLRVEIRQLLYGKRNRRYKVYFAIDRETEIVRVFHVRHWAFKPLDFGELRELTDDVDG